jgi:DMSO reductase anchor subunit
MATPIGTALLDKFAVVFIAIFIFAIVYGLLELVKIFGPGKKNLHAIIAMMIALMAILSSDMVYMIKTMLPWISLMIVFFFFLHAIPMFMGMKQDEVVVFMGGKKRLAAVGWVLGAMIFLVLYSLSNLWGERLLQGDIGNGTNVSMNGTGAGSDFKSNLFSVAFNPKVLGLFIFMLIATLTVNFLTKD